VSITKIDALLGAGGAPLDEDRLDSPSSQIIAEILGAEQIEEYSRVSPEMYQQHRKLHSIMDDFQWGEDYKETYSSLAKFFKEHPREYQVSLEYGARLSRIAELDENDPQIDSFAREAAELIKSMPILKEILFKPKPIQEPMEGVFDELVADILPPARIRFNKLLQRYLGLR
jgi:hypothetical protein